MMKTNKLIIYIVCVVSNLFVIKNSQAKTIDIDTLSGIPITFSEYMEKVANYNLSYIAEKYNLDILEAEVIASKVVPDPDLTIESDKDCFTLELSYTLELGGKHTARVKLARQETELERFALKHFFRELQAEAAEAFVEALMEREVLLSKISSYHYMQQLSNSDSIRYQLGEISENEARQSYIEAITLLNEVFEQEAVYKNALLQMQQFTGKISETMFQPVGSWKVLNKTYHLADLINMAIENRADLMAFEKQIAVSQDYYRLVKAERRPDVDLMIGYEKEWRGILPKGDMLKGGITIPLKFSNFNKGELKASKLMIEKTQAEYQDALLQVQTEVASALYDYEALDKQLKHFTENLVENARKVMEGITYMYQRGETGITEVLIAQRDYNELREDYFQKSKDYASALINLEKSCGIWNIDF